MYVCHVCMVYIYVHMQVKMCTCVYLLCVVGIYVLVCAHMCIMSVHHARVFMCVILY